MYGFGDDINPAPDTVNVMEEILMEYIADVVKSLLPGLRFTASHERVSVAVPDSVKEHSKIHDQARRPQTRPFPASRRKEARAYGRTAVHARRHQTRTGTVRSSGRSGRRAGGCWRRRVKQMYGAHSCMPSSGSSSATPSSLLLFSSSGTFASLSGAFVPCALSQSSDSQTTSHKRHQYAFVTGDLRDVPARLPMAPAAAPFMGLAILTFRTFPRSSFRSILSIAS